MGLSPGSKLGPYEILNQIGIGGMGEVYRARDRKLGREVAIKALPDVFANDRERLARFEREAHVLASLNHPNIAIIHELHEAESRRYLILELVEGETLAQRLSRGPIPINDALEIARQIAMALEVAHEKGIVHRDLKPANVKIAPDGRAKVLDFGLAKASEPAIQAPAVDMALSSATTSDGLQTAPGIILGTASYMSPEQARGKDVDRRSDVWSFGCVLYEMLSGRQIFPTGETPADTLAAILGQEPDWRVLPSSTPQRVRILLERCLRKDPRRRWSDMAVARIEIEEASTEPTTEVDSTPSFTASHRREVALGVVAIILFLTLIGVVIRYAFAPSNPKPSLVQFDVLPPGGSSFQDIVGLTHWNLARRLPFFRCTLRITIATMLFLRMVVSSST